MTDHSQRWRAEGERGQALLEFALVIGFLLLLVWGIIDFSRVFFGYATMSNGAREGARYAIVHPNDDAGIEAAARDMMIVIGAPVTVGITFPDDDEDGNAGCRTNRCRVVVTATSDFPVWTPVLPNITLYSEATMHIE